MKTKLSSALLLMLSFVCLAQVYDFKEKFDLPNQVSETSGLLYINGRIVTHNDSGDAANLYELDPNSGNILRTISISNATHVDWEDIAESNTHIYVGDFGNNNGNRTDLTIYKILKSDFLENSSVSAEIINFSYEDQTNFSVQTNNHNFDAEALIFYNNELLIFSKNWQNFNTNVYKIPTSPGTYVAEKVSSANVQGLVTGATRVEERILLCGYTNAAIPFLVYIAPGNDNSFDVFRAGFERYNLISELGLGSQVEAITLFESGAFYLSRETLVNQVFNLQAKLFEFKDDRLKILSSKFFEQTKLSFAPNPTRDIFRIHTDLDINKIELFNLLGKRALSSKDPKKEIDISHLNKGMYIAIVSTHSGKIYQKKLIKL